MQRIRHKHSQRPYLVVGVSGYYDSLLELEPTRSNDRGLLSHNIDSNELKRVSSCQVTSSIHTTRYAAIYRFKKRIYRHHTIDLSQHGVFTKCGPNRCRLMAGVGLMAAARLILSWRGDWKGASVCFERLYL